LREKRFLQAAGLPVAPFEEVQSETDLRGAVGRIGAPAVLKTAAFGYDGKGQRKISEDSDLTEVWSAFGQLAVLEGWVPFEKEISVIVARGLQGEVAVYPVCENVHQNHILDVTRVPAAVSEEVEQGARALGVRVAEALDLVGVLAVEMFVLRGGALVINELAPRPHNSGHFSFDASVTSQFEQQLRAVCGLPLGSTESLAPAAMANLLGDLWAEGEPDWAAALQMPSLKLHLYGKSRPLPGRKMGHLVAFGATGDEAVERVREARRRLGGKRSKDVR
jgi:5-(carboxyamino)imidazole ribonucleotide synthase